MNRILLACTAMLLLTLSMPIKASYSLLARDDVKSYLQHLTCKYHFDYDRLERLFSTVIMNEEVVTHVKKPAEAKPWYEYRDLVVTQAKVNEGVDYWQTHAKTLSLAEKKYGVPASIIVAILGIETRYGTNKGTYPVFNTLATLAFNNGRRSSFFRRELTEYLLLSRENHFKPLILMGSYAGALGLPQFMPSSYRHYAVDFHEKGYADLFENHADAIGSIGNYLKKHGWKPGEEVVLPATQTVGECKGAKERFFQLQEANGESHWLALYNFYVISTYNKSELYVMAVNLLAQKIREQRYGYCEKDWQENSELECAL